MVLRGKCLMLGDSAVGKSAIASLYANDGMNFPKSYSMTIGMQLHQKLHRSHESKQLMDFFIFDSSGNDIFRDLCESNWDRVGMYIVVYDITKPASFKNAGKWMGMLKQYLEPRKTIPGVLLANKCDLTSRRKISAEEGQQFAEANGLHYMECSAKDNEGIEECFQFLADKFHSLREESPDQILQLE